MKEIRFFLLFFYTSLSPVVSGETLLDSREVYRRLFAPQELAAQDAKRERVV
jgi:hypothetical protein